MHTIRNVKYRAVLISSFYLLVNMKVIKIFTTASASLNSDRYNSFIYCSVTKHWFPTKTASKKFELFPGRCINRNKVSSQKVVQSVYRTPNSLFLVQCKIRNYHQSPSLIGTFICLRQTNSPTLPNGWNEDIITPRRVWRWKMGSHLSSWNS